MKDDQIISPEVQLESSYLRIIRNTVAAGFPEVQRVILFGSRAMWKAGRGSDIDLAIQGKNVNRKTRLRLYDILNNETMIPYKVDILNLKTIRNNDLLQHIYRVGKVIYRKGE